jgi:hypothetical protein
LVSSETSVDHVPREFARSRSFFRRCFDAGRRANAAAGTFRIVVRDPAKLPIAAARVTLTPASAQPLAANTNDRGEAILDAVPPGVYVVTVESPGFMPIDLPTITIRSGARTTREVELKIATVLEEVNVTPPDADRQLLDAFTDHLTPDQIAALPDDPDELLAYLQQLVAMTPTSASTGSRSISCRPEPKSRTSGSHSTRRPRTAPVGDGSTSARVRAAIGGATP